jgi:hypothetical protein
LLSEIDVAWSNQQNHLKFIHKVSLDPVLNDMMVIYFPKNFFLVDVINEKLSQIITAGLVDHWVKNNIDMRFLKIQPPEMNRQQLSVTHLRGAFYLFVVGLITSGVTFLLENIVSHIKV